MVTIVVLLILAGVSISLILDENGIIQKSKEARREYKQAQANEQSDIDNISEWLEEETLTIVEPANIADWEYTEEDDGTITINTYKGSDTTVVIPNYINGKTVKKIESDKKDARGDKYPYSIWHQDICSDRWAGYTPAQTTIKKVIISEGIEIIGSEAFICSYGLEQITIPNSVVAIEYMAFGSCTALTSITIPDRVTTIEESTFYKCTGLTNITIPSSVKTMGEGVFSSIPSITVNVPFKEGKTPKGWDADWNKTIPITGYNVTVNYLK